MQRTTKPRAHQEGPPWAPLWLALSGALSAAGAPYLLLPL